MIGKILHCLNSQSPTVSCARSKRDKERAFLLRNHSSRVLLCTQGFPRLQDSCLAGVSQPAAGLLFYWTQMVPILLLRKKTLELARRRQKEPKLSPFLRYHLELGKARVCPKLRRNFLTRLLYLICVTWTFLPNASGFNARLTNSVPHG